MSKKIVPVLDIPNMFTEIETNFTSKYVEVWKRVHIRLLTTIRISKMLIKLKELKISKKNDYKLDLADKTKLNGTELLENEEAITQVEEFPATLFHPNKGFKVYWNIFLGICLLYTAVATPFLLAFIANRDFDIWFILDLTLSGVFILDFIFALNTAYQEYDGKLIISRKKILINYLKGWLIIDLVSCFPFELLSYLTNPNGHRAAYNNLSKLIRLKNIPRLFRLSKILVLFKNSKSFPFLDKVYYLFSFSHSATQMLGTFFMILLSLHIVSCLWYFMARFYEFGPDTWIYRRGLLDSSLFESYLTSLYWALTTLSTVGYGDITPKTTGEILLSMGWMIVAIYFLSFAISSISSLLSQQDGGRKRQLDKKLALLDSYSEENKLPRRIKTTMQKYLKETSEKNLYNLNEKEELLNEFSAKLRFEIAQNAHRGAFSYFTIFINREERFIYTIIPLMKTEIINKGSCLYIEGEQYKDIYFMIRGKAYFVNKAGIKFKVISQGNYCGDIEVVKGINRLFSVKIVEDSSYWVMGSEVFKKIEIEFPLFYKEFEVEAEKRFRKLMVEVAEMTAIQKAKASGLNDLNIIRSMVNEEYEKVAKEMSFIKSEQNEISRIEKKLEICKDLVGSNGVLLERIEKLMLQLVGNRKSIEIE